MSIKNKISENATIIVREVGERTADLCVKLIEKQVHRSNVFSINVSPFSEAVRKTFEIGLRENKKWTVVFDADVLIFDNVIENLINYADSTNGDVFEIEGVAIDKFLLVKREVGNHIYRTSLIEKAIPFVDASTNEIRPETFVKNKMVDLGYKKQVVPIVVGLHDYEQNYSDVYRKTFVHSKKHINKVENLVEIWGHLSMNDPDFKVALIGLENGKNYTDRVTIDIKAQEFNNTAETIKEVVGEDKARLVESSIDDIVKSALNEFSEVTKLLYQREKRFRKEIAKNESKINQLQKQIGICDNYLFRILRKFRSLFKLIFRS